MHALVLDFFNEMHYKHIFILYSDVSDIFRGHRDTISVRLNVGGLSGFWRGQEAN